MKSSSYIEILLVEDSPDDAELAVRALREDNIANEIHVVVDGKEALDFLFCEGEYAHRAGRELPKVVLLDMKLPKLDGLQVLERLRADPRTALLPVVLLTSSQEQSDIVNGYKLRANAYIVKPIDFLQFKNAIQRIGYFWVILNHGPQTAVG